MNTMLRRRRNYNSMQKDRSILKKRVNRSVGGNIALFILMLVISSFMALPLVFVIGSAFKPLDELWIFPPNLYP